MNGDRDVDRSPLSPNTLLSGIQVTRPNGPVTVEGRVQGVRPWTAGGFAYLTLTGDSASIAARVPLAKAPAVGETIRITGVVTVAPQKLREGLQITVIGDIDGRVRPNRIAERIELRKARRVALETLLRQSSSAALIVIGTERAYGDLSGSLTEAPVFVRAATTDAAELLQAAQASIRTGTRGVIFTRGGSSDATEDLWDDPRFVAQLLALDVPFYTAIGHSDRLHLADMYADQAFATPTQAGEEIRRIEERVASDELRDAKYKRLQMQFGELHSRNAELVRELEGAAVSSAPQVTMRNVVIIVASIAIVAFIAVAATLLLTHAAHH